MFILNLIPIDSRATIPMRSAKICLDCNIIVDGGSTCPRCAGRKLYSISVWLDRKGCPAPALESSEGRIGQGKEE